MYIACLHYSALSGAGVTDVEITYSVFRSIVDKTEIKLVAESLGYEGRDCIVEDDDSIHYFTTIHEDSYAAYMRVGDLCYLFSADPVHADISDSAMFYWCGLYLTEVTTHVSGGVTYQRVHWEDDSRGGMSTAKTFPDAVRRAMLSQMYSPFETSFKTKETEDV